MNATEGAVGFFKRFYSHFLGISGISEEQTKTDASMEEPAFKKDERKSVHEHSEIQRKWVEELQKPKN